MLTDGLRARVRPLSQLGAGFGIIAFFFSFTPSLLPRPWDWQAWVTSATVPVMYAIGVMLAWVGRSAGVPPLTSTVRRRVWYALGTAAVVVAPLSLWLGAHWQHDLRAALGMPADFSYSSAGILAIVAGVCAAALMVTRGMRAAGRYAGRPLRPWMRRTTAAALVVVLVSLVITAFTTGQIGRWTAGIAGANAAASDAATDNGIVQPESSLRSGSPASLVSWVTLGRLGRTFVTGGPTVTQIERVTGRPALPPIRVYAGTASAPSLQAEAGLVLAELERTGAFDRALIAIGVPDGQGGIDDDLAAPVEYMFDGNTAIASMQYSHQPSWVAFVGDETRVRDGARMLFNTVFGYWSTLSPTHRPRLVVFGGSLGALGAADAFSGLQDLLNRAGGALLVGPPRGTMLWQQLTRGRATGSPFRLPIYGDGLAVRFAASPADLRAPDGGLRSPHVVVLQHASDPVVWWSPDLLWSPPEWLREPRGPAVPGAMQWFPVATFMQLTGDLQKGLDPPAGFGHHYGATELVTAWAALLHPPRWTDAATQSLAAAMR